MPRSAIDAQLRPLWSKATQRKARNDTRVVRGQSTQPKASIIARFNARALSSVSVSARVNESLMEYGDEGHHDHQQR